MLMNALLAEVSVGGACAAKLSRSQAVSMVRTGRWSNTLVASHLLHTPQSPLCGEPPHIGTPVARGDSVSLAPKVGRVTSVAFGDTAHRLDGTAHVTGLPKVSHHMRLRPSHVDDLGPMYNASTCVGGVGGLMDICPEGAWPP